LDEVSAIPFFVDRFGVDWFGGNDGYQTVSVTADDFDGNGTLSVCLAGTSSCTELTNGPISIPPGSQLRFQPAHDENGLDYYNFSITLDPVTDAPPITVHYVINVNPINDPPVLIAHYAFVKEQPDLCDEDTYIVIHFEATDIDSPKASLKAKLSSILYNPVKATFYPCDDGSCTPDSHSNTAVVDGDTWVSANGDAQFYLLLVPEHNLNGDVRLLFSVLDDYNAESDTIPDYTTVRPVNDFPSFDKLDGTFSLATNKRDISDNSAASPSVAVVQDRIIVTGQVSDIDFKVGHSVILQIINYPQVGNFSKDQGLDTCVVSDDNSTVTCVALITDINSFFAAGFEFYPSDLNVQDFNFTLACNDTGNIDWQNIPNTTYATLQMNRSAVAALVTKGPAADNTVAFIIAPIAALLAAALVAALIFLFRKNAAAKVQDYFDRMALDMAGSANSSPLYQGASKGGESPLYKS